jgi:dihydrofolate synthase/folylpolyglutamate synthase
MACAIVALRCLRSTFNISVATIQETFKKTQVLGRYQRYARTCPWILDVAHNVQAVRYLMQRLNQESIEGKRIAIFCCMVDKNIQGMMLSFCPHVDEVYLVPLSIARAASTTELLSDFERSKQYYPQTQVRVFDSVEDAVKQADQASSDDCVIVFGSFYLLEAVIPLL